METGSIIFTYPTKVKLISPWQSAKKKMVFVAVAGYSIVNVQQHRICFVIGLLMCTSTLRRPLSRICGTAERLQPRGLVTFFCSW